MQKNPFSSAFQDNNRIIPGIITITFKNTEYS